MGGKLPRYFVDDLLSRVDIVDLIEKYIPLKKVGANFVARCPFHVEKTPSFNVNRTKQMYYCFGCGAGGDAIHFLMEYNHLKFVEAVEDLATLVGMPIPLESLHTGAEKVENVSANDSYQLLDQVASYYERYLRFEAGGRVAVNYLKGRGVDDAVAKEFRLGYAPDEWRQLVGRFDQQLLVDTGMVIEKENSVYDRFRGRIMFPIRDKRGRVIGFGGRVMNDVKPKYLNSPETSVFHKSKEVYGLYELLEKDTKPKRILIVEGYMDVIALAGRGVSYAVATLGTSTSQAHLDLLFRFTGEVVLCFDGDKPGNEAAWRAMESVFSTLRDGRQVRVLLLPQNHDPDSLVREIGAEKFNALVDNSQALSDYFFNTLAKGLNLSETEGRSQLVAKATHYLAKLPEGVFKDLMHQRLRELAKINALDVSGKSARLSRKSVNPVPQDKKFLPLPRRVIAFLVQYPELVERFVNADVDWDKFQFPGSEVFKEIVTETIRIKPINCAVLLEHYRDTDHEKLVKNLATVRLFVDGQKVDSQGVEREFKDALDKLIAQAEKEAYFNALIKRDIRS